MRGKKLMDVGSGFGVDSITAAQRGASLTDYDSGVVIDERAHRGT